MATQVYTNKNMLDEAAHWPQWKLSAALTHYGIGHDVNADRGSLVAPLKAHIPAAELAQPATYTKALQEADRQAHELIVHPPLNMADPHVQAVLAVDRARTQRRAEFFNKRGMTTINWLVLAVLFVMAIVGGSHPVLVWIVVGGVVLDLFLRDGKYLYHLIRTNGDAPVKSVIAASVSVILNLTVIYTVSTVAPGELWIPFVLQAVDTVLEILIVREQS